MKIPVEEQPAFRVPYPEGQPFTVSCSGHVNGDGHHTSKLLHRGVLVTKADGSREIAWVVQGQIGAPWTGPVREDGDRTVSLKCRDRRICRLDRQFPVSELIKALEALAEAGLTDRKGRVCLDIAHVPR